ncbi:MAG: dihydroorotate dehydrogenase [Candidatus Zixiibacteriota bacterium]|nr:MAG: dihydroorotate dehydrogenase [candidate division Zixibacteria bacterium]
MKPDLKVTIAGVDFANPIMTASGCSGYGEELSGLYPLSKLGALLTKTITPEPREGHPPPRTAETASGMLNAIGLANVGVDRFIEEKVPFLRKQKTKIIVNVGGRTVDEYVTLCDRLSGLDCVDMIELNLGCPNVDEGGMQFGSDPAMTERTVREAKQVCRCPLIAKLTPNVTDITATARAAEQGGADVLSLINSLVGMAVDVQTWRPVLTYNRGGLTGPAIKPVALAQVDAVCNAVNLPVIGIGGIADFRDVVEFLLVGASAVQIGTTLFVEPDAPLKIVNGLKQYMKEKNISQVSDLVGRVRKY